MTGGRTALAARMHARAAMHRLAGYWRSIRTTNAIERMQEEFKRRIKTQCVLLCSEAASMLFWALLASGQITLRKVDGWRSLAEALKPLDLAA